MSEVVVVGGGAAGCVVAARLAEPATRSVLLLEAGPDRRSDLPRDLRDGWTIERETFDWGFVSSAPKPQPVRRKRIVGGTSWLTRFTPRGAPADYDGWAARGLTGWAWESVLPYFVRLESDLDFGSRPWHGDTGPIPSSRQLHLDFTDVGHAALEALDAGGFPWVDDHNEPGAVGAGRMPMNVRDGRRVTTADAYLSPDRTPSNLTVRGDALVDRVMFDGTRAVGVLLADGSVHRGRPCRAVLRCLRQSGDPAPLRHRPPGALADMPGVGANLTDHPWSLSPGSTRRTSRARLCPRPATAGRLVEETPDLMLC